MEAKLQEDFGPSLQTDKTKETRDQLAKGELVGAKGLEPLTL
jgi:hypothetical protein